jgi:hypothetical protein
VERLIARAMLLIVTDRLARELAAFVVTFRRSLREQVLWSLMDAWAIFINMD